MPEQRPRRPERAPRISHQRIGEIGDRPTDTGCMARNAELIEQLRDIDPDRSGGHINISKPHPWSARMARLEGWMHGVNRGR